MLVRHDLLASFEIFSRKGIVNHYAVEVVSQCGGLSVNRDKRP
jgi:hypothetical protein